MPEKGSGGTIDKFNLQLQIKNIYDIGSLNLLSMHFNMAVVVSGTDKSIAQLPGTSPNFGWASVFLFHLPRQNV